MAFPSEPILASTLWSAFSENSDQPAKRGKLATDCRAIDNALNGGLPYGELCCISAEPDSAVKELSRAFLSSHLLSAPEAEATVIDSTLAFDVRALHKAITATIGDTAEAAKEALALMGRLKIMKVFDFIGLTECISELRGDLEDGQSALAQVQPHPNPPKGTIGDSEDEEEMLDSPSPPVQPPQATTESRSASGDNRNSLVMIDNIAHIAAPLLKNNHVQGQALLTSFMRSLSHLAKAYRLCILILNGASSYTGSTAGDSPSSFSSCTLRPALGKTFTYLLDVHLLLHRVPKTAADARAVYGAQAGAKRAHAEMINVLEVAQDRYGGRVGRWAPFAVGEDGRLVEAV